MNATRFETLLKRYEDGDVGGLIEALLSAIGDSSRPGPHERIAVERWAVVTALCYVCHVSGIDVGDSVVLPQAGRTGRWSTRFFKNEIPDLIIYHKVRDAREAGKNLEEAIGTVGGETQEHAVRAAYRRATKRLQADPDRYRLWESLWPMIRRFGASGPQLSGTKTQHI